MDDGVVGVVGAKSVGNLHVLVYIIGSPNTIDYNPISHFPRYNHLCVTMCTAVEYPELAQEWLLQAAIRKLYS